jgi:hypothetical protein
MPERKTIPENEAPGAPATKPHGVGRARRRIFALVAGLISLAPLILLEAGLRLFEAGGTGASRDGSASFDRSYPLFERQGSVYRTARSRAPFIAPQEFPAEKPANGFRIFCFGGSTVYGHPYLGDTAFPKWLELELGATDRTRTWQAINCGGVSYASYRIAPMVREVLAYQPDLILVATGHNEFLEDRTYNAVKSQSAVGRWVQRQAQSLRLVTLARQWRRDGPRRATIDVDPAGGVGPTVNTRLDYESGYASYHRDTEWHQRVLAQYDESVRTMVADCQAARVPIVLVRLGSNLRDCPPFKSEHRAGLTPEAEAEWQAAFDIATATDKADLPRASQFYREAAAIDGEYALLSYRIARALDRGGDKAAALSYFEKARDQDICPLRIISAFEECLARISAATGVPLVDGATVLAAKSPDAIPGFDWYVDHVHPTIAGHQVIARTLAEHMRKRGLISRSALWSENERIAAYSAHLDSLNPAYFSDGQRRLGWLENWAKRQRLADEVKPADAPGYARRAFRALELGQDAAAREALAEAMKRDPNVAGLIKAHAGHLQAAGRVDRAAILVEATK